MRNENGTLQCNMRRDCTAAVTHVEEKGWIYCAEHGAQRQSSGRRCRKMRPWELALLRQGKPLPSYEPKRKPVTPEQARSLPARNELERESGRRGGA